MVAVAKAKPLKSRRDESHEEKHERVCWSSEIIRLP